MAAPLAEQARQRQAETGEKVPLLAEGQYQETYGAAGPFIFAAYSS
jgi:hypothetical protein